METSALILAATVFALACGSSGDGSSGESNCNSGECKLTASDAMTRDTFGFDVAIDADVIVVGAGTSDDGDRSGSAYVYRFDGADWVEQQKLFAPMPNTNDQFGISVAIAGDVIVIGAQLADPNGPTSGSAYVYRFDGTDWLPEQELTRSDGATGDLFGISVDISGDVIVVGAFRDDDNGRDSGSLYVFRYDPLALLWVEEQKLLASDGGISQFFGFSVAIDGDTIAAGAYLAAGFAGAIYTYQYDSAAMLWGDEQKLVASDAVGGDLLGYSVDISGDVVVAGAYLVDVPGGVDAGSAYVYLYDGTVWGDEQKLTSSDAAAEDNFGINVAIDGDRIVVGSYRDDDDGSRSGSAYVYRLDGSQWVETRKITASDGRAGDYFGNAVDLRAGVAVVGAYLHDGPRANVAAGSAYVYEIER